MSISTRPCPLCASRDAVTLYHPAHSPGPVARCKACGMVYVSHLQDKSAIISSGPVLDGDPALLTSDNLIHARGSWELKLLAPKIAEEKALRANALDALKRISPFAAPPGDLLDFGCGFGFFLGTAKQAGWSIHGLEPLPVHAIHARSQFGAQVITDVLRDDTYPPEKFDVITSFQVFEHLPYPAQDLARLRRALKLGGVILIEVPNIDTWSVKLMRSRHRHFVMDHLNFFSIRALSALLQNAGFQVVNTYHPTRRMTMSHLTDRWLAAGFASPIRKISQKMGLRQSLVSLNLGDIIAVIARRI